VWTFLSVARFPRGGRLAGWLTVMGLVLRLVMGIFLRLTQAVLSLFTQDAKKKPKFAYGLCEWKPRIPIALQRSNQQTGRLQIGLLSTRILGGSNFLSTVLSIIIFQVAKTRWN
jgi:hypothetical protein